MIEKIGNAPNTLEAYRAGHINSLWLQARLIIAKACGMIDETAIRYLADSPEEVIRTADMIVEHAAQLNALELWRLQADLNDEQIFEWENTALKYLINASPFNGGWKVAVDALTALRNAWAS